MNEGFQTHAKAISTPVLSFMADQSGPLKSKCLHCGTFSHSKVPHIVHEGLKSTSDHETRPFTEMHFGHDLSCLKIYADLKEPAQTEPDESKSESGTGAHPYTASASIASSSSEGCKVPPGNYGSAKIIKFRILDFNGKPVKENLTVGEKFASIEDNYKLSSRLVPNSYDCKKGFFDDCYRLYQPEPLPDNFRLVVEQNHLLGSEVISKNQITYTPDSIMARVFPRRPGKHDFETHSKMY